MLAHAVLATVVGSVTVMPIVAIVGIAADVMIAQRITTAARVTRSRSLGVLGVVCPLVVMVTGAMYTVAVCAVTSIVVVAAPVFIPGVLEVNVECSVRAPVRIASMAVAGVSVVVIATIFARMFRVVLVAPPYALAVCFTMVAAFAPVCVNRQRPLTSMCVWPRIGVYTAATRAHRCRVRYHLANLCTCLLVCTFMTSACPLHCCVP